MKIYIHTDLEGVTNVKTFDYIRFNTPENEIAKAELALDVNAAAAGAFDAGAEVVAVLDSHAGGGNISPEVLDSRILFDVRDKEDPKWWGHLNGSYAGTMFIGAHAMSGTQNAFLDHTQSSIYWYNYYINGKRCGELAQWAMVAGHYNVPMIMVSGDEAAVTEAHNFFGEIECVPVKRGVGRNDSVLYDADTCRKNIRKASYRAVKALAEGYEFKPYKPVFPAEIKLELCRADYCDDIVTRMPHVERMDARTVRYMVPNGLCYNMAIFDDEGNRVKK